MNDPARFFAKVNQTDTCWLWLAQLNSNGYARFRYGGRTINAHRAAYMMFVGPIPKGLTIDHICRVRNCVNPKHLRLLTQFENTMAGETITAKNKAKQTCPRGHPYDIKTKDGIRKCRTCKRAQQRAKWAENKESINKRRREQLCLAVLERVGGEGK